MFYQKSVIGKSLAYQKSRICGYLHFYLCPKLPKIIILAIRGNRFEKEIFFYMQYSAKSIIPARMAYFVAS